MESTEYTDIQHHEGNRAGIVVSVRLKPEEAELLRGLSDRDGRTLSETLRVALHALANQPRAETIDPREDQTFTRGGIFISQPHDLMLC
jgi:hypothetical protein